MNDQHTPGLLDRVFELRTIVAILFGVYGIFCTIWGIGFTTAEELKKAAGYNVNLIAGIAMIVVAIGFSAWVVIAPVEVETRPAEEGEQ